MRYQLMIKVDVPAIDDAEARETGTVMAMNAMQIIEASAHCDIKKEWKVQRIHHDKGPVKIAGGS